MSTKYKFPNSSGMSFEEIEIDFPYLKRVHILAALGFAANREQLIRMLKVV